MHDSREREHEDVELDAASRQAVWSALTRADRALAAISGQNSRGKWEQRAIGDRAPLTVCIGRRARLIPELEQFGREDSSWAHLELAWRG